MRSIDKKNAKRATVRGRVKWKQVGDKCTKQFFQAVKRKNSNSAILGLRNGKGEVVNKRVELEGISFDFYKALYKRNHISEDALREVLEDLPTSFTKDMNEELVKPFSVMEFYKAIEGMVDGKAPGHDGIPIEFFKKCWRFIGEEFTTMIVQALEREGNFIRE